jgi:MFS family permease
MPRLVTRTTVDRAGVETAQRPRQQPVLETRAGDGEFDAVEGAVWSYRRTVTVTPAVEGGAHVTETVDFELAVPYFAWLVRKPFEWAMRRPDTAKPWWMPPQRLDARASAMLGTLAGIAMVFGYLNTLFTQTIAFAGEEFGAGNGAQGLAGSVVRLGGLIALGLLALADRRGRRAVLLGAVAGGCVFAATGALSPSLTWLAATQVIARGCAVAVLVVASIITVEEMPAGSRAWAMSLLAMAAGFGAGVCVASLRLADLGRQGWRLLYVLPLLALPLVRSIARRLPESRRFERPHVEAQVRGHGTRLWLLGASGFLANLFVAPNAQFNNRFLRDERHYSGGAIALLSLGSGTPGVIGIVAGGRLADVRGRRMVAAVSLTLGTLAVGRAGRGHRRRPDPRAGRLRPRAVPDVVAGTRERGHHDHLARRQRGGPRRGGRLGRPLRTHRARPGDVGAGTAAARGARRRRLPGDSGPRAGGAQPRGRVIVVHRAPYAKRGRTPVVVDGRLPGSVSISSRCLKLRAGWTPRRG